MPYITKNRRDALEPYLQALLDEADVIPGEYNYILTKLMHNFVKRKGLRYSTLNAIVGFVECAKAEFARKVVVPYEKTKIAENGDIFLCLEQ